jgi:hypothetical protein
VANVNATRLKQKKALRDNLVELCDVCPFHQENPEDCPLFELRKLKPAQRLEWLDALPEEDLVFLATYHQICLSTKIDSALAAPL